MSTQELLDFLDVPSPDTFLSSLTEDPQTLESIAYMQPDSSVDIEQVNHFKSSPPYSDESTVSSSVDESQGVSSVTSSLGSPPDSKLNALKYPPCAVCSGKSSGMHYGCYTCEACKNFFRRYLLRNEGFNCKKGGKCSIINKSRGNCSGCRLRKCLDVGMSKHKSKIGRYTHTQRTETIKEVKKLEGKLCDDEIVLSVTSPISKTSVTSPISKMNNTGSLNGEAVTLPSVVEDINTEIGVSKLSEEDQELIKMFVEAMDGIEHFGKRGATREGILDIVREHNERYQAKVKLFGPLNAISKEEYFTLLRMYNIDLDGRWNTFKQEANNCEHIVARYCNFAYKIPGFTNVCLPDQERLLKNGHCDFFIILLHTGYVEEYSIFLEMNGVPSHIEEAADKIFSREAIVLMCELYLHWQKLNLSKEEMAVLMAMSLVCTDRCTLDNPGPVEAIHSGLTNLFLRLLESLYGSDAQKRFAKMINVLLVSRKGSELYFKEYQEMSENKMVVEAAPAFPTLCPDKDEDQ